MKISIGFIALTFSCVGFVKAADPAKFTAFNLNSLGSSLYGNAQNRTLYDLPGGGSPSNPSGYDTLSNPGPLGVAAPLTDVYNSSVLSTCSYFSPASGQRVIRIFYQTTSGTIRSVYHADPVPLFSLDSMVLAVNVPLGSTFTTSCAVISSKFAMMIQYLDNNGILTQRWSTSDTLNSAWSVPKSVGSPLLGAQDFSFNLNTASNTMYVNAQNGTMMAFTGDGTPSAPNGYDSIRVDTLGTQAPTNVAATSDLGSFTYISPSSNQRVVRAFYQTTSGDIRSLYHADPNFTPLYSLDATTIVSGLPVGTPFSVSCFVQSNSVNSFVMVIRYLDSTGTMKQRWSTSDTLNSIWSSPVTVPV